MNYGEYEELKDYIDMITKINYADFDVVMRAS